MDYNPIKMKQIEDMQDKCPTGDQNVTCWGPQSVLHTWSQ